MVRKSISSLCLTSEAECNAYMFMSLRVDISHMISFIFLYCLISGFLLMFKDLRNRRYYLITVHIVPGKICIGSSLDSGMSNRNSILMA